jgi:hypothetical protein
MIDEEPTTALDKDGLSGITKDLNLSGEILLVGKKSIRLFEIVSLI